MKVISGVKAAQCYKGAFDLLLVHEDAVLVHGYPRLTCDGELAGKKFGHAWIEIERFGAEWCIDHRFPDSVIPKAMYYAVGEINASECKRYSRMKAMRKAYRTELYGPWGKQPSDALFGEDAA